MGETKRPLHFGVKEHKKHTQLVETLKTCITDHAWSKQHQILKEKEKIRGGNFQTN